MERLFPGKDIECIKPALWTGLGNKYYKMWHTNFDRREHLDAFLLVAPREVVEL